jgi:ribosomal-protein-alanine N-acetyltransferase
MKKPWFLKPRLFCVIASIFVGASCLIAFQKRQRARHSKMQNNVSTKRLILDIITPEDHEFMIQLVNSKGWLQFIGDRNIHSKEDAIAYINKVLAYGNIFYWVVRKKDGNLPIGIISFLKREYLKHYDIGFAFLPEFNGYGYAYEAAKEILALASPEYHPILAATIPGNIKSIKLLIKLGLHFDNEMIVANEKMHIYSNNLTIK